MNKDAINQEVEIGDVVAYAVGNVISKGTIVKFTPKGATIEEMDGSTYTINRRTYSFVKLK